MNICEVFEMAAAPVPLLPPPPALPPPEPQVQYKNLELYFDLYFFLVLFCISLIT